MSLAEKLARWQQAGLIDDATAARILAHEEVQRRPWLIYALGGLGALTFVTGLISIIAANWEYLGPYPKLAGALLFATALAVAIVQSDARGAGWVRETLLIVLYGDVLAVIGLIAQVYQLGGRIHQALLVWSGLTALLASRGRSVIFGMLWWLGLSVTWLAVLNRAAEAHWLPNGFAFGLIQLPPVVLWIVGSTEWLHARRPGYAGAAVALGTLGLLALVGCVPQFFYLHIDSNDVREMWPALLISAGLIASLIATTPMLLAPWNASANIVRARLLLQVLFGVLLVLAALSLLVPHRSFGVAAALSFILLWLLLGGLGYLLGWYRLLHTATALIAIRVLIVYFEVFGSLLDTGLGLITGGLLTLFLTWLWVRQTRRFQRSSEASSAEGQPS